VTCPDSHINVCTFFVFLLEVLLTYCTCPGNLCNSAVRKMQKIKKHFWKRSSKKVILPDALSALASLSGDTGASLAKLFDLNAPAAMKRGAPIPSHGALVPYSSIWAHPIRRQADSLPQHQQASGINAGVMLLKPSKASWMGIEEPRCHTKLCYSEK